MDADPTRDRRDARTRLQRFCHSLRLELVRPASAKLARRPLKTVGDRFNHMEGSSSRTRSRHRTSHRLTNSTADRPSINHSARWGSLAAYEQRVIRTGKICSAYSVIRSRLKIVCRKRDSLPQLLVRCCQMRDISHRMEQLDGRSKRRRRSNANDGRCFAAVDYWGS